jgi:hypothetical protein
MLGLASTWRMTASQDGFPRKQCSAPWPIRGVMKGQHGDCASRHSGVVAWTWSDSWRPEIGRVRLSDADQAAISFSLASGTVSRKVCIGVFRSTGPGVPAPVVAPDPLRNTQDPDVQGYLPTSGTPDMDVGITGRSVTAQAKVVTKTACKRMRNVLFATVL